MYLKKSPRSFTDEMIAPYVKDRDFLISILRITPKVWKYFSESDRNNPEFALEILCMHPQIWKELPEAMK